MAVDAKPEEGLRSRKKALQRQELLTAAMELLSDRGYEETRIEDIAKAANVSLKTVYNYFPSKQSILIEILREDRVRMLDEYEAIASNPPKDVNKALLAMIQADIGDVVTPHRKKLWRELLAAETRSHDQQDDDFEKNREVFMDFLRRILLHFRKSGVLSERVNASIAAPMIYAIMAYNFRQYCAIEEMSPEDLLDLTSKQFQLLLASWMAA
jgi:AcrR family transcriptional regulator